MGILLALTNTIIGSITSIFHKKSIELSHVSTQLYILIGNIFSYIIIILFFILGYFDTKYLTDWKFLGFLLLSIILFTCKTPISQHVYKVEKMSNFIPYENINKILTIVISFFLFKDVSIISLFITLFAVVLIITFSIDLKKMKFPKNILHIFLRQIIQSFHTLTAGYIIITLANDKIYFIFYIILINIIFLIKILYFKERKNLKKLSKKFYKYRIIDSFLGTFCFLIHLFLMKSLGIIVTFLLSFIGMGITLFSSYLFFNDVPKKKNILLTILITILVGFGFYFK